MLNHRESDVIYLLKQEKMNCKTSRDYLKKHRLKRALEKCPSLRSIITQIKRIILKSLIFFSWNWKNLQNIDSRMTLEIITFSTKRDSCFQFTTSFIIAKKHGMNWRRFVMFFKQYNSGYDCHIKNPINKRCGQTRPIMKKRVIG